MYVLPSLYEMYIFNSCDVSYFNVYIIWQINIQYNIEGLNGLDIHVLGIVFILTICQTTTMQFWWYWKSQELPKVSKLRIHTFVVYNRNANNPHT